MSATMPKIQKGYKQTEIGVIPEDWEVKQLGDIASVVTGSTPPTIDQSNYGGEYFFVSPSDLGERKYILQTEKKLSKKGFGIARKFPRNSILFTCIGSTIGKSGIALTELTSNQQINAILPNERFFPDFLFYALGFRAKEIQSLAGEQAVPMVNKTEFEKTNLALPKSKLEQKAIAEVLSDTDALIERLGQLIEKKRWIKQGAMQRLLTGKQRLPGFTKKWESKRLGDIAKFYRGQGLSKADLQEEGAYQCIHYGQLFTEYKEIVNKITSHTDISNGFLSKKNDVLMPTSDVTPRGLATASCIMEDGVVLGGGILVIRLLPKYYGAFLSYFISQNKDLILKLVKGSTVFHLYANDISNLEIDFPDIEQQEAIISILSDMDAEIEALERQRAKYRNIKQGMMQSLLTGRIRLPLS